MPLGMWVGVGRCNHVLDVGPDPPREGAILGANMALGEIQLSTM